MDCLERGSVIEAEGYGSAYEDSPLKVGFIGRDTREWGDMKEFIKATTAESSNLSAATPTRAEQKPRESLGR